MPTTKDDIRRWLDRAKENGATHMVVVCDTFDHGDYPVNVMPGESARDKVEEYSVMSMQRVMECYDLAIDWESQLGEQRAFHY